MTTDLRNRNDIVENAYVSISVSEGGRERGREGGGEGGKEVARCVRVRKGGKQLQFAAAAAVAVTTCGGTVLKRTCTSWLRSCR